MADLTNWARRKLAGRTGLVPVEVDVRYASGKTGKAVRYKSPGEAKKLIAAGKAQPVGGAHAPQAPVAVAKLPHKPGAGEAPAEPRKWVEKIPGLPNDTLEHYMVDGKLTPQRAALHEEIKRDFLKNAQPVPPGEQPVCVMMMGGPASGKSAMVKSTMNTEGFVVMDADAVKERLPEYQDAADIDRSRGRSAKNAAAMVHEESSMLAKQIRDEGFKMRTNLILDRTGRSFENSKRDIEQAKAKGYRVVLIYAHVEDPEIAIPRVQERAERTGRLVPEAVVRDAYNVIPKTFNSIQHLPDEVAVFNTSKFPPTLAYSRSAAGEVVHDTEYYGSLTKRGNHGYTT